MQGIESLTTAIVSTALDASSMRQQVIAANIANAGRAGYTAQRVSFEATVAHQMAAWAQSTATDLHRSSVELRWHLWPDVGSDGAAVPVRLDVEVGALAQNGVHYQALIKGLNKYMSLMSSAVSDGKR